jgi:cytochrome c-type biogenesis protein CcsB
MYITFEIFLANLSFLLLFISMLLYWIEASNFNLVSLKNVFNWEVPPTKITLKSEEIWVEGLSPKISPLNNLKSFRMFGSIGMLISNLSLFMLLALRWYESGHFPLSNLYESLMFLSWSLTLIHLVIEIYFDLFPIKLLVSNKYLDNSSFENSSAFFKKNILINKLIGSITAPCALFINAFATFTLPKEMQESSPLVPALQSNWLMMHVTVMVLSYSALILGSLLSIGFLIISNGQSFKDNLFNDDSVVSFGFAKTNNRALPPLALLEGSLETNSTNNSGAPQSKVLVAGLPSNFVSLSPDIQQNNKKLLKKDTFDNFKNNRLNLAKILDNLSYRILGLGFPLLTIGILSGAVWANEAWGSYWSWDPKETWALLTWLVFAIYLHTRLTKGWQGKKPALIASLGFITVWICFLGVNLIGEGLHSYGWLS